MIFKQLFRVFAHIYACHFDKIQHAAADRHLNTLFAHFICFSREFDLIDRREFAPLQELILDMERENFT